MATLTMRDFDLVSQLGNEFLLVEVAPKPVYEKNEVTGKNEPTGEIDGYHYTVVMPGMKYKSMRVTVISEKPIITQQELDKKEKAKEKVFVAFEDLACNPYVWQNNVNLSFKSQQIHLKR